MLFTEGARLQIENRTSRVLKVSIQVDTAYQMELKPNETKEVQVPIAKVVISE